MRYSYAISYESDATPVITVRGELDARNTRHATLQAGRTARDQWPKGRRCRSVVTVIERLGGDDGD